jgi:hypothetical protein
MRSIHPALAAFVAIVAGMFTCQSSPALQQSTAGGAVKRIAVKTDTSPSSTSSIGFVDLPGAQITVSVVGAQDLITASFSAESQCSGPGSGRCSVRILIIAEPSDTPFEPSPPSGVDYTFDTDLAGTTDDLWEGHALERSVRLTPGFYRVKVQRAVTNLKTVFRLDDWHFSVTTYD